MNRLSRLIFSGALVLALLSTLLSTPVALGDGQTRRLELHGMGFQFTSFTCLNHSCSLAQASVKGTATSNLATGAGSLTQTLIVDFSPGGTCNIVDESNTFSFGSGTISVHSHHEDCATQGLRVDTTFDVTGGTGVFKGATGGGREQASAAAASPINYLGTISF